MTKRNTPKWTEELEAVYGNTQRIKDSRLAELIVMKHFADQGHEVIDYQSDESMQRKGIDCGVIKNSVEVFYSVKGNLKGDGMAMPIEIEGLARCAAHRQIHVNVNTGYLISYPVTKMREWIMLNQPLIVKWHSSGKHGHYIDQYVAQQMSL